MLPFRHPAAVIDSIVADLEYLTEFLLSEIDDAGTRREQPPPSPLKAVAALEGIRVLVPRLRLVRSNFVADARLPDSGSAADLLSGNQEIGSDASQTPSTGRDPGLVR